MYEKTENFSFLPTKMYSCMYFGTAFLLFNQNDGFCEFQWLTHCISYSQEYKVYSIHTNILRSWHNILCYWKLEMYPMMYRKQTASSEMQQHTALFARCLMFVFARLYRLYPTINYQGMARSSCIKSQF